MDRPDGHGTPEGLEVFGRLQATVVALPAGRVINISLEGVDKTDASFPRESVIRLAKELRGVQGICLTDLRDPDLLFNWESAALKKEQPLICWNDSEHVIIGPSPKQGCSEALEFVLKRGETTARELADELGLKLPNASMKLKQLFDSGFVLRREDSAQSGGVEYFYTRIKP